MAGAEAMFIWAFSRAVLEHLVAESLGRLSVGWSGTLGDGNCLSNAIAQLLCYEQQQQRVPCSHEVQVEECTRLRQRLCRELRQAQPGSLLRDSFTGSWPELTKGSEWDHVRDRMGRAKGSKERAKLFGKVYGHPAARIWAGPAMIRLMAILLRRPIVIRSLQGITASDSAPHTSIWVGSSGKDEPAGALPAPPPLPRAKRRQEPEAVSVVHGQPVSGAARHPASCLAGGVPAAGKPWVLVPGSCSYLYITVYPHTAGLSIEAGGSMRAQHLSEGLAYYVGQGLPNSGQFIPSPLLSPDTIVLYNDGGTHFWLAHPNAHGPPPDAGNSTVLVGAVEVPVVRMDFA